MKYSRAIKYSFFLIILLILIACLLKSINIGVNKVNRIYTEKQQNIAVNYFARYMNIFVNDYIACPAPEDSRIKKKLQQGFQWYYQQALQGNTKAQYIIGSAYIGGVGTELNFEYGRQFLYQSAVQGYAPAQAAYGTTLLYDKKLKQQMPENEIKQKMLFWIQKAASQGDLYGKFILASYYFDKGDFQKVNQLMSNLAEQNYVPAQAILGDIYYYGDGVPVDQQQALYWYMKVINSSPPMKTVVKHAILKLYDIYALPGKYKDDKQAKYWVERYHKFDQETRCE